jgi:hypothetical protein
VSVVWGSESAVGVAFLSSRGERRRLGRLSDGTRLACPAAAGTARPLPFRSRAVGTFGGSVWGGAAVSLRMDFGLGEPAVALCELLRLLVPPASKSLGLMSPSTGV